jgi:predicted phage terminase large subunit-like protein
MIDAARVRDTPRFEPTEAERKEDAEAAGKRRLQRTVVAIDQSATHGPESDFTGIVVIGLGLDGDLYVLHAEAVRMSPNGWANRALDLAEQWGAGTLVLERNTGGEMAEHTIRNAIKERQRARKMGIAPRIKTVVATKGKLTRAEPVAALYEQGRVHHVSPLGVANPLAPLEEQLVTFPVAAEHDDLVDALVWGSHEMMPAVDSGTLYVV